MSIERIEGSKHFDRRMIKSSSTPLPQIAGNIASIPIADLPNIVFSGAIDSNTIIENFKLRGPKNRMESIELSDCANRAIAEAIAELESGSCRTFPSIDELLEDLESD